MSLNGPVLSIQPTASTHTTHPSPVLSSPPSPLTTKQMSATNAAGMSHGSGQLLGIPFRERANSESEITLTDNASTKPPSPLSAINHTRSLNLPSGTLSPVLRCRSLPRGDRATSEGPHSGSESGTPPRVRRAASPRFIRRAQTVDTEKIFKEEFEDYTQVNQYKVLDIIGSGSYGIVRKATSIEDDETYAMKMVGKGRLKRKGFLGRPKPGVKRVVKSPLDNIKREIAILKKLDHPNVVRLFEVLDDEHEDDLILVFEYLPNGTVIGKLPMETLFTEEQSRNYFVDVILGLEYLHSQHVIHRDIKPMNLLLDDDYRIKIADFGVSEEIERTEANLSRWAGTPAFVAPECLDATNNSFQGQAVDIWAAGVTLYCFVLGKVPWSPPAITDLYDQIKTEDPPLPDSLPADLRDLLSKLLEKDPKKRITIPEIRQHPWVLKSTRPIPTIEENCNAEIDVSEEDMKQAIKPYKTPIHILAMIKQMAVKRSLRRPFSPRQSPANSPVGSPVTSPRHAPDVPLAATSTDNHKTHGSVRKREKFARSHNAPPIIVDNVDEEQASN